MRECRELGLAAAFFLLTPLMAKDGRAAAGEDRRVKIATTIDFLDYVFYDNKNKSGADYYPLEVYEQRIKEIADAGVQKIYLRVDCLGLTLYPAEVSGLYGGEYGNHAPFGDAEGARRLENTIRTYDIRHETIRLARQYGLEVWAWIPVYDDAGAQIELVPGEHGAYYEKWGRFPLMDPYFRRHPEGYAMLDPRKRVDLEEARRINGEVKDRPARRIVFRSGFNSAESTLKRFNKDGLRIYVSDDNQDWRLYEGPRTVATRRDGNRNLLEIDGLEGVRECYVKLGWEMAYPKDSNWSFGIAEARGSNLRVYDADGRELPTHWGMAGPDAVNRSSFLDFKQINPAAWDWGRREVGFFKGVREGPPEYFYGMAEFLAPATLEHKLARFAEIAACDFDGFMHNLRNHSYYNNPDDYGFNPEVRAKFLERHGKDIWKDDFDDALRQDLRAEGVDAYLVGCRRLAGARPIYFSGLRNFGPGEKPHSSSMLNYGRFPWRYAQWFAAGSVDGVMMLRDYFPEQFTPEVTGGRDIKLGQLIEVGGNNNNRDYDFEADFLRVASRPIDEVELYETLVLTNFPEKYLSVVKRYRDGGLAAFGRAPTAR